MAAVLDMIMDAATEDMAGIAVIVVVEVIAVDMTVIAAALVAAVMPRIELSIGLSMKRVGKRAATIAMSDEVIVQIVIVTKLEPKAADAIRAG
jgi:hypothetical protein